MPEACLIYWPIGHLVFELLKIHQLIIFLIRELYITHKSKDTASKHYTSNYPEVKDSKIQYYDDDENKNKNIKDFIMKK